MSVPSGVGPQVNILNKSPVMVTICPTADPGFSVGGGANPPGEGANTNFLKNCMKLRKASGMSPLGSVSDVTSMGDR